MMLSLSAVAALIPAAVLSCRGSAGGRSTAYWSVIVVAAAGPLAWLAARVADSWHAGLSTALWATIAASILIFAAVSAMTRETWRLHTILMPYLLAIGLLAAVLPQAPAQPPAGGAPAAWLQLHIVVAVLTYSLLTVAAVAGVAGLLQERALKARQPTGLTRRLPSLQDCEALAVGLMIACEVVLAAGLLTGMATQYFASGTLIELQHKPLLAVLTFVVIGLLLFAHFRFGVRGRRVTRYVLLAYLLLTLAYPGVKFVTDVILA